MIYPAQWILKHGPEIIKPFRREFINPASYDVTLAKEVIIRGDDKRILPLSLMPGEFVIACTNEYFNFPLYVAGDIRLKSTIGRMGINHVLSVWFDPGFQGEATLELQNISNDRVTLEPDMKIAQMVFHQLSEPTNLSYQDTGRYVGQVGPTKARSERTDKKIL